MKGSTRLKAELPYRVFDEKGWRFAECSLLGLVDQGKTERAAERNLKKTVAVFLASCLERGTLDEVLEDCGFIKIKLADIWVWVAQVLDDGTNYRTLAVSVTVNVEAEFISPQPRVEIPSVNPWMIQANVHGQALPG